MNVLKSPPLRANSFVLGAVMSLLALCLPKPALAVRHWFTDENRHLVKTPIFEASVDKNTYCDPASRDTDVIVQLQFLSDIDFEVSNNPTYLQIVQSAIAPVVHDVCGEVTDLVILNFFSRPLKNRDGGEIPASRAIFRNLLVPAYPAQVKWVWFDAIFAGKFPPANADSFGNDRLTTEHAIRSWLSKGWPDQLVAEFERGLAGSPKEIPSHRSVPSVAGSAMSKKPKAGAAALTVKSLSATGLSHEETLVALYRGAFEDVEFNRENLMFEVLFRHYLNAYAKKCSAHLPANKVEITTKECATERVTRNGFGVEISRVCVEYVNVGTGLYADPELYAAKKEVDRILAGDTLRQAWRLILMAQKDPFGGPMSMASAAQAIADDMSALVQMNDCASPGMKRFEENLRLFALNQQPIRLDGEAKSALAASEVAWKTLTEQDYERLIEELVADQAKSWAVNRYIHGSVGDVSVSSRDAAGRPSRIEASYSYDGFNGRSHGSVDLHFTEGSPDCLYFSDAPAMCRTANRKIAASFFASLAGSPTELSPRGASASRSASVSPIDKPAAVEPVAARVAAPVEPPPPLAPKRELRAVNYIQGIKDACLEVLTGGDRREPEISYCFCLSASAGSIPVSDADAQWLFENFSDEALAELERRYAGLVRRFASCRAQLEANR